MAFLISFVLLLGVTFILADYESSAPCLKVETSQLGGGCSLSFYDCTKITCRNQYLDGVFLSVTTINIINKCDEPLSVDVTVEAYGSSWSHNIKPGQRIAVPGLLFDISGKLASGGIYLKVELENTGDPRTLKVILLSGIDNSGEFETLTSNSLAQVQLPISLTCEIERWWYSLSTFLKVLVVGGGVTVLPGALGICCYRCCRFKRSNRPVVSPRAAATGIKSTRTNIPMKPLVNEI